MSQQPLWVSVLSALLTPIIAIGGAWIAYQQWRLARNKLKLDLFDRRFAIYEGTRELLRTIFTTGRVKDEDLFAFLSAVSTAKWLTSPEVDGYLRKTLYAKAVKLAQLHAELDGVGVGEERTRNVQEQRGIKEWFLSQQNVLDEHFADLLRLGHEDSRRPTGTVRLGIFLTCLWVICLPMAYALGAHLNPQFLHSRFEWAYGWWEDAPSPTDPLGLFTSFTPEANWQVVASLTFGVPAALWLLLFVLPKSLTWVTGTDRQLPLDISNVRTPQHGQAEDRRSYH